MTIPASSITIQKPSFNPSLTESFVAPSPTPLITTFHNPSPTPILVFVTPTVTPSQPIIIQQSINLVDLLQVSEAQFSREYTKGTLAAIGSETITLTNISNQIDLQIGLSGLGGISFNPPVVDLPRGQSTTVNIEVDSSQIDKLPEGLNTYNLVLNVTSNTIISIPILPPEATPLPTNTIPVIIVEPPPIPPPAVTPVLVTDYGTWALTQIDSGSVVSSDVVVFTDPSNAQPGEADNNFIPGFYFTQYGRTITTTTGPSFAYALQGGTVPPFTQPTPPPPTITVTYDPAVDDPNFPLGKVLVNTFLHPLGVPTATPLPPTTPLVDLPDTTPTIPATTPTIFGSLPGQGGGSGGSDNPFTDE